MSLPSCFVTAADTGDSCPVVVVDKNSWPAWREKQPASVLAWVDANGFNPVHGSLLLVPDASGKPQFALAAIADAGDPFALAHLPTFLPAGDYRLGVESPVVVDAQGPAMSGGDLLQIRPIRDGQHVPVVK